MGWRANVNIFRDTMSAVRVGGYVVENEHVRISGTLEDWIEARVFSAEEVERLVGQPPRASTNSCGKGVVEVTNQDSFTAAEELARASACDEAARPPLVLNFANPVEPGGGVTRGASAQEEDLCRRSTLYLSINSVAAEPYYRENSVAHPGLFTHNAILSPHVWVFRASDGSYLREPFEAAVLTVAAPYVPFTVDVTSAELRDTIATRVRGMLRIAATCGYDRLVLGAWGCGAFGNDPNQVAVAFREALREVSGPDGSSPFDLVRFAVPGSGRNHEVFARVLGGRQLG